LFNIARQNKKYNQESLYHIFHFYFSVQAHCEKCEILNLIERGDRSVRDAMNRRLDVAGSILFLGLFFFARRIVVARRLLETVSV